MFGGGGLGGGLWLVIGRFGFGEGGGKVRVEVGGRVEWWGRDDINDGSGWVEKLIGDYYGGGSGGVVRC